jgi:hypothetical protein
MSMAATAIDILLIVRVWTFLKFQHDHEPKLDWAGKR